MGAAPGPGDDGDLRARVARLLARHATGVPDAARQALLQRLRHCPLDVADPGSVAAALRAAGSDRPVVVYLALPPVLFPAALDALAAAALPAGSRVAVEKPFGDDLAGAVDLNARLAQVAPGVGRLPRRPRARDAGGPGPARPADRDGALAGLWDGAHLAQVDVLWEETMGLEGRGAFFDRTGALRDVVQNHVLQLLALAALEIPAAPEDLPAAKLALLRSLTPGSSRRARWTAGRLAGSGHPVPDYAGEHGVDPDRGTETLAEVVLTSDAPRWAGTRVVLRAGKALAADRKGVRLHPRPGVHLPGAGAAGEPLWYELDRASRPGAASGELLAYTAVLDDLLGGGSVLSVSAAEAEQTWRVLEPVLQQWAAGRVPLLEHPAGTAGP